MAKSKSWEVTDDFWSRVEPLIPVRERVVDQLYARKAGGGRKPKDPRLVFEGIVSRVRHQMTQVVDSYRARFKLATTKGSTGRLGSVF